MIRAVIAYVATCAVCGQASSLEIGDVFAREWLDNHEHDQLEEN